MSIKQQKTKRKAIKEIAVYFTILYFALSIICMITTPIMLRHINCLIEKNNKQEFEIAYINEKLGMLENTVQYNVTFVLMNEEENEERKEQEPEFIGRWRITAYCSCKQCCGEWANSRPNGIVFGASGEELVAGISIGSSATLPFGTNIQIDEMGEYIVQDRVAQWVINKFGETIDIYFDDHKEASDFGTKYLNVYIIKE